jgi:hypothetical protein
MALITAYINVNFTSNFSGTHRVCWRIGSSGPYNCTTVVACGGNGTPCSASITVTVDNETCDEVLFEGYVQATCRDPLSEEGRIPFSATFTPNPTCKSYAVACTTSTVRSVTVTYAGNGYDPSTPPAITFTGGGGTGAAATAVVGDGGVKTFTITNGGAGYNGGATGNFTAVPAVNLTGTGAGATFNVTVTLGVVTAITLHTGNTAPGTGYAVNDTFEFAAGTLGGSGAGVVITVNTLNTGEIQYIQVTNPGSGYTSAPTVTIGVSPINDTATATSTLTGCPTLEYGFDCSGGAKPTIENMELGQGIITCYSGVPPTLPEGYTITAQGCCYDCVQITVDKPDGIDSSAILTYTVCDSRVTTQVTITQLNTPMTLCVVNNSWLVTEDTGSTTITNDGPCP